MNGPSVVPRRAVAIAGSLLVLFVLIAAAVNVPWALSFMRSRTTSRQVPTARLDDALIPGEWPSSTPHDEPWPPPVQWDEGGAFGCRVYDAGTDRTDADRNGFSMEVQHLGWPFPVIEQKEMWWDWDDPKLKGPEPDPALSLKVMGLVLNPLIIGGGPCIVLVLPWFAAVVAVRSWRRKHGRCMACGYPIGESAVCTECGEGV